MGAAFFYHLTERPLEATLPVLLGKALGAGWRVAVRGTSAQNLERLDQHLWQGDGFLPHGMAGGPHDADQPVILTMQAAANGATCVMSIDGAEVTPDEIASLARVCILFDGANPEAVEHARAQWRSVTEAGLAAEYWAEDGGSWVKKAEAEAT
ncbi:MAG: DNA polymerase III subunit chi [Silicimonas sp.]|nr:DNA polymerase III subunit chi [Silicimonas sp.]